MISRERIKNNLLSILLFLFVVMSSGYMLQVCEGKIQTFIQYFDIFIFIMMFIYHFIFQNKFSHCNKSQGICLLFMLSYLFSMLINCEKINIYLSQFSIIFCAFFIVEYCNSKIIVKVFINGMFIISLISLLFTGYIYIFGAPNAELVNTSLSSYGYYNYYIYFYPDLWSSNLARNSGLFWEPGIFASYLIIASILEITFSEKINYFKLTILILTTISTFSTAGIIMIVPLLIMLIERTIGNLKIKWIVSITFIILTLYLLFNMNAILNYLYQFNSDIFGKITDSDLITTSTRIGSPLLNIKIFKTNPLFGAGINGATNIYNNFKGMYRINSQTSTSTYMLAVIGIFGITYTLIWIYSIIKIDLFSLTTKCLILILILFIINKEPHNSLMATWLLFFLFYKIAQNKFNKYI